MSEPASHDDPADSLEEALANALAAHEIGGAAALEEYLAQHPAAAPRLREALADLQHVDLMNAPPAAPARFGEFAIKRQLGSGGMGVVYLAEQTSLGREVALKVVRPELLFFDGARERFRREIDAVAKLEHPAIVPILATGSADGVPWYAMPCVRGCSAEAVVKALTSRGCAKRTGADLAAVLEDTRDASASDLDGTFAGTYWQAVVRLLRKAALGIQHAHARGILHRDLKPSNLMLTADGRAVVLDFGLAQARGDAKLTRTGSAAGSPAYMAPEQVRGEAADERTDVYGLGATLHCLLGLRPPFAIDDPEELRTRILAGTRQPLPDAPAFPAELGLVLDTAMDVDRVHRYPSAQAFADDLQAVLDGRPIVARRLPMRVRLRRFAARHRVLTTGAVALLVFLVALPSALLWQQHTANLALAAQVRRADLSAKTSVDAVETLLAAVAHERMMHVPAAQDVAAEMLRRAIALFDELAGDAAQTERVHLLRIRTLSRLANVEGTRGRYSEAIAAATRANELCGDGEPDPVIRHQRAAVRRVLAGLWVDSRRTAEAEAMMAEVRADLRALAAFPDYQAAVRTETAHLCNYAAAIAGRRGDPSATEAALRACVAAYRDAGDVLALASAQINLGQFLKQGKRLPEALECIDAALAITTSPDVPRPGWPVPRRIEASARREQALLFKVLLREADAAAAFGQALRAFDDFLVDYPEETTARVSRGATANDLGLIHVAHQEWATARSLFEAACRDQLAVLARNPDDAAALRCLREHRRSLCRCLGKLEDFASLEPMARALGAMTGDAVMPLNAAIHLMRCAAVAAPDKAASLRTEALDLLVEAKHRGGSIDADGPDFAPLRDDARFRAIATPRDGG